MAEFEIQEGLPKPGEQYEFTAHELQEFIKCANDPVYFIRNYMKIIQVDRGLVPFDMYDFQEEMIRNYHENRFCITMCSRQVGKALDINTEILTANGWKRMLDVHPGDQVYTPKGTLTEVIAESPIFTDHDVFAVKFDTGDVIRADRDHLWTVEVPRKTQIGHGRVERKLTTVYDKQTVTTYELQELIEKNKIVRIRTTEPLRQSEKELPMDSYLFGLWLGDGLSGSPRLVGNRPDVDFYQTQVDEQFIENQNGKPNIRLVRFASQDALRKMGVLNNKHIPKLYLMASTEQRLALLQGLMDTDGNSNGRGGCQFYQKASSPLVNDVRELLWSLGIKHRMNTKIIGGKEYITLQFSTTLPVFRLPRKLQLHTERQYNGNKEAERKIHPKSFYWYVKSVEQIESIPVKCISVADDDHLFLCGRQLIPTHNSTTVIGYFLHYIIFNLNVRVCISANKQKTAVDLLGKLKLAYENLPRFLQQGVTRWARLEIELSNGSSVFAAATSSSAVRGGSYNCISGASVVTIMLNGRIYNIDIETLYQCIANSSNSKKTLTSCYSDLFGRGRSDGKTEIKILSERGFTKFDGVKCTRAQQTIRLLFDNGAWIECTPDHNIYLTSGEKIAATDSLNQVIVGYEENHVRVIEIVDAGIQDVYDVLNVDKTHNFYTNGVLVSNCLLVDEFAFVPPNIADEFYASTFPTITSGKTTKIIMVSTPNGMNLFHRFWVDAQANRNDFVPQFVHWSQVPGRDEQWKLDTIRNIGGPEKFAQEYECVGPDTLVTVRDVVTGHIQLMRIEDVYAGL